MTCECPHFKANIDFAVCFCHALLLFSMDCGLLGGEFSDLSIQPVFNLHVLFILWFVLPYFIANFSMHCGFLAGEFSDL